MMGPNTMFYPPADSGVKLFNLASNFRIFEGVLQADVGNGTWFDVRLRMVSDTPTLTIEDHTPEG